MIKNDESLKEKFVRRGVWIYLFSFIIGPMGYVTKMILSADLTVEQIGVFYGIISLITLVGTYNDLGLTEALGYFLPKFAVAKQYGKFRAAFLYALGAQVLSSVVLGAGFFFFSDLLGTHYFKSPEAAELLRIFCLFFLCNNLIHIGTSVFGSLQETKYQYFVNFIRSFFSLVFVAALWMMGKGALLAYAWAWIFPLLLAIVWNFSILYFRVYKTYLVGIPTDHSDGLFKKIFSYALLVLLTANVGMLLSQVDMQLIITMLGPKEAGYYTNYLSLIGIPFILITPLIGFLFPVISGFSGGKEDEKIAAIRRFFLKYFSVAAIPVSLVLGLFGTDFAIAFFGEKFEESGRILAWSVPFLIFNFLVQINFQILGGLGKIKERLKILAIGLAFNVPLNLVLIPVLGASGSALAVGLSWIPIWYLSEKKCSEFGSGFDWRFFLKNLGILSAVAGAAFAARHSWSPEGITVRMESIFWLSITCLVHIIAFAIVNRSETRELFLEIRTMLKKKKRTPDYPVTVTESGETIN